ncbi:hypothetical protein BDZ91DRAFT_725743 [Kalaharituber pfeilii]|nr:hypothetical protein BDZ91DRAFT_725743 [Kalaharituber pfeilii]
MSIFHEDGSYECEALGIKIISGQMAEKGIWNKASTKDWIQNAWQIIVHLNAKLEEEAAGISGNGKESDENHKKCEGVKQRSENQLSGKDKEAEQHKTIVRQRLELDLLKQNMGRTKMIFEEEKKRLEGERDELKMKLEEERRRIDDMKEGQDWCRCRDDIKAIVEDNQRRLGDVKTALNKAMGNLEVDIHIYKNAVEEAVEKLHAIRESIDGIVDKGGNGTRNTIDYRYGPGLRYVGYVRRRMVDMLRPTEKKELSSQLVEVYNTLLTAAKNKTYSNSPAHTMVFNVLEKYGLVVECGYGMGANVDRLNWREPEVLKYRRLEEVSLLVADRNCGWLGFSHLHSLIMLCAYLGTELDGETVRW